MTTDFPITPPASPQQQEQQEEEYYAWTVGIWMSDCKYSKLPIKQLSQKINIRRVYSLTEAFQCSLLLHKVLDKDVKTSTQNNYINVSAEDLMLLSNHSGLLYPLENIFILNDRHATIKKLQELNTYNQGWRWNIPETIFFDTTTVGELEILEFPVIAKPISACSDPHSHTLHLVSRHEQLEQLPIGHYILQRFIHHSGLLLKVYIIGESVDIILKASLTHSAFSAEAAVIFDSQSLKLLERPMNLLLSAADLLTDVEGIAKGISGHLQLGLLGVDMIVEEGTGRIFVVDVNYFPGYSGVPDLDSKLLHLLITKSGK